MNRWTLWMLPLVALACTETVESSDVRTTGVYPEFRAVANGTGSTQVSARLKVGGNDSNTYLELQDGDRIEVSVGTETRTLDETDSHTYSARFDVDAAGTEFVFAFLRSEQDENAPRSVLTLPEPFSLQMTTAEVSRASGLVGFSWDPPASGNLHWDLAGDCVWPDQGDTVDDGSHSLSADDVRSPTADAAKTCPVSLTVQRGRAGSVDPAFTEGGESIAYQERAQSFTSTP